MARHRLDNSRWGFDSNCFVCEDANERGLRVPFFHDDDSSTVVAQFSLGESYSGAPTYVHGGLVLAILDEAMAWAAIALAGAMALTRTTTTTFMRPVRVDRPYQVEASLEGRDGNGVLVMAAEVVALEAGGFREAGQPCARARAEFAPLSVGQARAALGQAASGEDSSYVVDG